jgi:TolB-like protein/class 3 adenylate cyclase
MGDAVPQRRLAAILAADVVGFSRMMGADEEGTLARLKALRAELVDPAIAECRGRIFKTTGDGLLAEFGSVVDAVNCAARVQRAMPGRGAAEPPERRLVFRVGVNLGDILVEGEDIYGDGVNVAARLEGICEPGGVALSASAHEQVRDKLALKFVDRGEHSVKNIARPVRVYGIDLGAKLAPAPARRPRRGALWAVLGLAALIAVGLFAAPELARRLRPAPAEATAATIAVLPFANQSGDAAREYFSDGVTEDIIHALGRFSGVRVIAHNAVQSYKHRKASPEEVRRELRVRYLVQGSVREAGGRLRVGVELSDAMQGTQLWSDRYEGGGKEVFEIQDKIVRSIVGALAVKLTALEQQRAVSKPPENLEAYDLVLRARELIGRLERGANRDARALLAQALRMAPNYADAYVALGDAEFQRTAFGWIEDVQEGLRRSEEAVHRALAIDSPGANARAHGVLASVYSFIGKFDQALAEANRAIEVNGSDTYAHALRGDVLLWRGDLEEAAAAIETARRFDPLIRSEMGFDLALAYLVLGRNQDSLAVSETFIARFGEVAFLHAVRAGALAQLGRLDEAKKAAEETRRLNPFLQSASFGARFVNRAHQAKAQEGLRKAGL